MTSSVDPMVAIAELMKKGGKSRESTSWNSVRVGTNTMVGGMLAAWGSVLSASSIIQRTGKKKTRATSQARADHAHLERLWPGRATITARLIAWPPRGRS